MSLDDMWRPRRVGEVRESVVDGDRRRAVLARLQGKEILSVDPTYVAPGEYDRAIAELVAAVIDHPDVVAVYGDSRTPAAPGISDVDASIVVRDDAERLDDLQRRVDEVVVHRADLYVHGPVIVPESTFEYLPLTANITADLDHLAGEKLQKAEQNETTAAMQFFDRFSFEPYNYLGRQLVPMDRLTSRRQRDIPFVSNALRATNPLAAVMFGVRLTQPGALYLDRRLGLSKMMKLKHDWSRYEEAFGEPPVVDERILDRVEEYRRNYFECDLSNEEYLELLLDSIAARHELQADFVERQSVYPHVDRSFALRRACPTLATPKWTEYSPYRALELFLDAGIRGHVLPPEAALHLATLPYSESLFYGTPPDRTFDDPDAAGVVERRNEGIRRYLEFTETHDIDHGTFSLSTVPFHLRKTTATPESSTALTAALKRDLQDFRNKIVVQSWRRELSDAPTRPRRGKLVRDYTLNRR